MVRSLGLHAVAPGSNPVLTSGLDLFPVDLDSTLPRFVNSQLVAFCQFARFLHCDRECQECYFRPITLPKSTR